MSPKSMIIYALAFTFFSTPLPQADASDVGFIYGKITTRDGDTFVGTMRWGKQECFWDDLFNAQKDDNPWLRKIPKKYREKKSYYKYKVFGISIGEFGSIEGNHLFICRFGDIEKIKIHRRNRTTVFMKDGTEYELCGSGDLKVKIRMVDENLGKVKLDWDDLRTIEFMSTPKKAKTQGYRLKGKLKTREMDFEGYIMWDAEECLSTDILDGDSDRGDMEIEFGNIRSINRLSSRGCQVTLKDGREYDLRGTNDVNRENRGIYIEDKRSAGASSRRSSTTMKAIPECRINPISRVRNFAVQF